jgi:hypothetical protein
MQDRYFQWAQGSYINQVEILESTVKQNGTNVMKFISGRTCPLTDIGIIIKEISTNNAAPGSPTQPGQSNEQQPNEFGEISAPRVADTLAALETGSPIGQNVQNISEANTGRSGAAAVNIPHPTDPSYAEAIRKANEVDSQGKDVAPIPSMTNIFEGIDAADAPIPTKPDIIAPLTPPAVLGGLDDSVEPIKRVEVKVDPLKELTQNADIIIAALGMPEFLTGDMVKKGVVIIDVGITRVDDPSRPRGYRLAGDVHFKSVSEKASYITPVPGGVGPMTIAMLLKNTLLACKRNS